MEKSKALILAQRAAKRQKGVTLLEYALIAALIAVVAIAALTLLGGNIASKFNEVATKVGS